MMRLLPSVTALSAVLMLSGCQHLEKLQQAYLPGLSPQVDSADAADSAEMLQADADYLEGLRYSNGAGVTRSPQKAYRYFEQAAKAGHANAQLMTGLAKVSGEGTVQDLSQARYWLSLAAAQGQPQAQYTLGEMYINGRGGAVEEAWGVHWINRAAEQNYPQAQYLLAIAWATGIGLPTDGPKAWQWSQLAREQNVDGAAALNNKLTVALSAEQLAEAKRFRANWQPQTQAPGLPPAQVMFVQQGLNQLGFTVGEVDGLMGAKTRQGIERFRESQGSGAGAGPQIDLRLISALRSALQGQEYRR